MKLGGIDAAGFQAVHIDIASAPVPIPGKRVTVKWVGPSGCEVSSEVEVSGELPRAEGEGLAIVKFADDFRVYVSMHARDPAIRTQREKEYAYLGLELPKETTR